MKIRVATPNDAPALLAIYAQYIDTAITFEYTLPTASEFRERIVSTLESYPYLTAEDGGHPIGYAYAHRFRPREAYQWGAELSIYLDRRVSGRGIGVALYTRLIELLKVQGVRTVYGCVTLPNPASEKLHSKLGFKKIGVFTNAGFKHGEWRDVVWFEKAIAEYNQPLPPIPFPSLSHPDL